MALLAILLAPPVPAPAEREADVAGFRQAHRRTQLTGMGVLTGWAALNIGGGVGASFLDPDRRYFHQGNAIWNSVNLVIGIVGLATNASGKPRGRDRPAAQHRKELGVHELEGLAARHVFAPRWRSGPTLALALASPAGALESVGPSSEIFEELG